MPDKRVAKLYLPDVAVMVGGCSNLSSHCRLFHTYPSQVKRMKSESAAARGKSHAKSKATAKSSSAKKKPRREAVAVEAATDDN